MVALMDREGTESKVRAADQNSCSHYKQFLIDWNHRSKHTRAHLDKGA